MNHWLMKSEPEEVSIDDALAATDAKVPWFGVRNYQARNFMRDSMRVGDAVLFYHSGCEVPGIAGLAEVCSGPYPDVTQFNRKSPYFDAKAKRDMPRWILVDVRILRKTRYIALDELRRHKALANMRVLARGNRLSITPVTPREFAFIRDHLMQ